jgi:TetR/AcrR family transcriptional regulator
VGGCVHPCHVSGTGQGQTVVTDVRTRRRGRPTKAEAPAPDDDVLEAALRAFATYGYAGVSLRTLNRELGVSHNLLHQRFGSKWAIWRAAVDWGFGGLVGELEAADREHADPLQRLRSFIRTFVKISASRPELLRIVDAESTQPSDRLDYLCATYILPMAARFRPLYDLLLAAGQIRPIPPETIYYMITSGGAALYANDAMTRRLFGQLRRADSDIERYADAAADLLVGGLSSSDSFQSDSFQSD